MPYLRRATPLLVLIAGLGLVACSSRAGTGSSDESCERSSDCEDPTDRCVDGRCESECGDDRDCPAELSCVGGICTDEGVPCRADRDCLFDRECVQGLCEDIDNYCEQNGDCPNGSLCDGEARRCFAEPGRCLDEADCVAGQMCVDAVCVDEDGLECSDDGDCPQGEICVEGACAPECLEDRDCEGGLVCVGGSCASLPDNNATNNATNNDTGGATCDEDPSVCDPSQECCDGACVARGACPDCVRNTDCAEGEVCLDGQCEVEPANNDPGDDYWDTCGAASECQSDLCLGDPMGTGRCVTRCTSRATCPQEPVASFCIQSYHLVTQQDGGQQLIGLCYQDDTGAACNPQAANSCIDGLCVGRSPGGVVEGQCSIRCQSAADCAQGLACGPKEFNVGGQAQLIDVCVPIGETCAGVGAEAADQCYSSFCVTDDDDVGVCTTLCETSNDCPVGWGCVDVGGGSVCAR